MKKFNTLIELNNYINDNPIFNGIDIENLTVQLTPPKGMMMSRGVESTYPCYIIFNDKESYENFKSNRDIILDYHSINAVHIEITLSEFRNLKPKVKYIEFIDYNEKVEELAITINDKTYADVTNWGWDIAELRKSWDKGYTGKGVRIAVIDGYFEMENNFIGLKDVINFRGDGNQSDHGTICASVISTPLNNETIVGIANGSEVYGLGTGLYTDALNQAYQWCIDNDIDILSLSYGYGSSSPTAWSPSQKLLIDAMNELGIIVVASSGNNSNRLYSFPAAIPGVISVGSVADKNGIVKVGYGGGGTQWESLDFIFAGEDVPCIGYKTKIVFKVDGSSLATPGIVGFLALLKEEFPDKTKEELIAFMKGNSFRVPTRYGVFPVYTDYEKVDVVEGRIAKVNNDGSLQIKGSVIEDETCEKTRFDSSGNLYVKTLVKPLTTEFKNTYPITFKKDTIQAKYIIENSKI